MNKENNNTEYNDIINYLTESSDDDFETMQTLYKSGKFAWALFLGHISVEKLLKALYVTKINKPAPYIHNLYRIAELSLIEISEEYADWLDTITTFNINARYEDYKREFYKMSTPDFTLQWIEKIIKVRQWIKKML